MGSLSVKRSEKKVELLLDSLTTNDLLVQDPTVFPENFFHFFCSSKGDHLHFGCEFTFPQTSHHSSAQKTHLFHCLSLNHQEKILVTLDILAATSLILEPLPFDSLIFDNSSSFL